jgi:hypothetical protein
MSTRIDGATVLVLVSARATLSAGPVHMALSASEGTAPGTWRYALDDGQHNRAAYGRVAGEGRPHGRAPLRRRHLRSRIPARNRCAASSTWRSTRRQ